ncbi:MAG: hypothetical protein COA79_08750 [Planctomycetota bacterium]|nr:MAG: hypothetical protein COA79_08750 [Planctomycetota bacterium]
MAAIVIPQFSGVAKDSVDTAIKSNLQTVRSAIQVYKTVTKYFPVLSRDLTRTRTINGLKREALLKELPLNTSINKTNVNETTASKGTFTNKKGWNYNKTTGEFWADTTGHENF